MRIDTDGNFFISDRIKELIKVKGFQVAPAELEDLICSHPDVSDAAVVGVAHAKYGEVPRAFVVRRKNSRLDETKLREFVESKVSVYKQLDGGVEFVDEIPKSSAGKILRRFLKEGKQ